MSPRHSAAALIDSPPASTPSSNFGGFVPLHQIQESVLNPRKRYDAADLADLVESIRQHGVIEPLVVRRDPSLGSGKASQSRYEIVAGSRRYRAAKIAGVERLPVMVRDVTDAELLELALEENVKRAAMSPVEEAQALEKLTTLDPIYRDDKVLAGRFGRSETYIRNRRKLLKLAAPVLAALDANAITATHAERIARLPVDIHALALAACFDEFLLDTEQLPEGPIMGAALRGIEAGKWDVLAPALIGLRKFDDWTEQHGKVDVTAPEVQQQLIDDLGEEDGILTDEQAQQAVVSVLQLSESASTKDARALNVIPPSAYRIVAKAKHRCEFTRKGVVVHPPQAEGLRVELLDVCTERRRCAKHWPAVKAEKNGTGAAKSSGKPQWQIDQERRDEERKAWDVVWPSYRDALAIHTAKTKLTPQLLVELFADYVRWTSEQFGIKVTTATIAQLLVLRGVRTNALEYFAKDAKELGLDVRPLTKAIAAEQKAAALSDTPPKGLSGVDLVVWRAIGTFEGGRSEFVAAIAKGIRNDELDRMIRRLIGTGGYIGDDCEYHATNGQLSISKPVKAKLTVGKVRAAIRRLLSAPPAAPKGRKK